jgi:hypothetical protein
MNWITERISERSSHDGIVVAAAAAAIIWGGMALLDVIVWGALIWGVWKIIRKG